VAKREKKIKNKIEGEAMAIEGKGGSLHHGKSHFGMPNFILAWRKYKFCGS